MRTGVGFEGGKLRGHLDDDRSRQRRRDIADEVAEVDGLLAQLEGAGLGVRQCAEVFDQPREVPRLLEQLREMGLVAGVHAIEQPLDAALQDGERRPQLVGDIGHQLPPQAVLFGERPDDGAEGAPECRGERHDQHDGHRRDRKRPVRRPREQRDEGAGSDGGEDDQGGEGAAHTADEGRRPVPVLLHSSTSL
jgi:hypothetical protein